MLSGLYDALHSLPHDTDDSVPTHTSRQQIHISEKCRALIDGYAAEQSNGEVSHGLNVDALLLYLHSGLSDTLSSGYVSLDNSRVWILYWILHSMTLCKHYLPQDKVQQCVDWLVLCQNGSGGYGGGPQQMSHAATTFAAVCCVYILAYMTMHNTQDLHAAHRIYSTVNRAAVYNWLCSIKQASGAFSVHIDGEVDTRGTYCCIATASMLNILDGRLSANTAENISDAITYEGAIGGELSVEAHGGYTYCGFAALVLLHRTDVCRVSDLLRWAAYKQLPIEGGYNGRTNKLVDGCYSFWVGALYNLIELAAQQCNTAQMYGDATQCMNSAALQKYLLLCCTTATGGMRDKPGTTNATHHRITALILTTVCVWVLLLVGKGADYYHTCYCLSGLSLSQHNAARHRGAQMESSIVLQPSNVLYNVVIDAAEQGVQYFDQLPHPTSQPH